MTLFDAGDQGQEVYEGEPITAYLERIHRKLEAARDEMERMITAKPPAPPEVILLMLSVHMATKGFTREMMLARVQCYQEMNGVLTPEQQAEAEQNYNLHFKYDPTIQREPGTGTIGVSRAPDGLDPMPLDTAPTPDDGPPFMPFGFSRN